jgi:hypothetical protein
MRGLVILALAFSVLELKAQAPKGTVPVPVVTGFIGNKEAKVYHTPACRLVAKTKPENRVLFATQEEAAKAGYAPCRICIK